MNEWISIDDSKPADLKAVLLWLECVGASNIYEHLAGHSFGWYSPHYGWYAGDHGADEAKKTGHVTVTHWMPLPEPPK